MGLIKQDKDLIKDFRAKVDKFGLPFEIYQILECLFRQSLMVLPDAQFEYDRESSNKELCDKNLSPEKRIELVKRHIKKWERDNPDDESYGFNKIRINEIDGHSLLIEKIKSVFDNVDSIVNEHSEIIQSENAERFKKSIQETLVKNLMYKERPVGRYFDEDSKKLKVENFDFFTRYLACANAIFNPFFKLCYDNGEDKLNKFNPFLSQKMKLEFTSLNPEIRFSGKKINDRIKNNKKKTDIIADEILKVGLITDDFHLFLYENLGRLSRVA